MAEVLLFAVKSGLKTSVCLKATNTIKEPLMLMLEDLPKVTHALEKHKSVLVNLIVTCKLCRAESANFGCFDVCVFFSMCKSAFSLSRLKHLL